MRWNTGRFRASALRGFAVLLAVAALAGAPVTVPADAAGASPADTLGNTPATKPPRTITRLSNAQGSSQKLLLGLQDRLTVTLSGDRRVDPDKWVLLLNGKPMRNLPVDSPDGQHQLRYQLRLTSNPDTRAAWTALLGAPDGWSRKVAVSVAHIDSVDPSTGAARLGAPLTDADGSALSFDLNILGTFWLAAGFAALGLGIWAVVDRARKTAVLRDKLLPQIPPLERPYSLGRVQMAFWFVLIMSAFVFLWLLLWDYNTITSQALVLMGISGATGLGAIAANGHNDQALNDARRNLRAANFNTAQDILKVRAQLQQIQDEMADNTITEERRQQLTTDRSNLEARTATYKDNTQGWTHLDFWTDIINDDGGPALHRIQVVAWTIILGVVFLLGVYRDLTMPQFSATLLALMAISGGTYVGFKIPEQT